MAARPSLASIFVWALRLLLAALFVYAGLSKALNPKVFADNIEAYQLLPYRLVVVLALYLPWLEVLGGIGVLWNRLRSGALVLLILLLTNFIAAAAWAWWQGLEISCGCFGSSDDLTAPHWIVTRNVLMVAVAMGLLVQDRRQGSLVGRSPGMASNQVPTQDDLSL